MRKNSTRVYLTCSNFCCPKEKCFYFVTKAINFYGIALSGVCRLLLLLLCSSINVSVSFEENTSKQTFILIFFIDLHIPNAIVWLINLPHSESSHSQDIHPKLPDEFIFIGNFLFPFPLPADQQHVISIVNFNCWPLS